MAGRAVGLQLIGRYQASDATDEGTKLVQWCLAKWEENPIGLWAISGWMKDAVTIIALMGEPEQKGEPAITHLVQAIIATCAEP